MKQFYSAKMNQFVLKISLLFLFALLSTQSLHAQNQVEISKRYLTENSSKYKLSTTDITDMTVSSAYLSPTTGWYHVYFNQTYQSIDVYNGVVAVTVKADKVAYVTNSFTPNIASRVPIEGVKTNLSALEALKKAATRLDFRTSNQSDIKEISSSKLANGVLTKVSFKDKTLSNDNIDVKLYWLPYETQEGEKIIKKLALSWNVHFNTTDRKHSWNVHVDAISGEVIKMNDDVIHCDFGTPNHLAAPHICTENIRPTTSKTNALVANSYAVFDYPLESPNHGSQTTVANPYTRFAPTNSGPGATNGWHNDGINDYTNTRGNNVWAKDDIANDNETTYGHSPSSGLLEFNFPYTHSTGTAATNLSAAVTNLFYWNNVIHDVLWRYGFDEPSGNFQASNQGRGGQGNDFVYADAQDGSGTNNANFQTPTDGGNPRMQMYIWSTGGSPSYTPDSDFDNGVIAHEYGHGWSIRLTGGPANSSCLQNAEQGGEGWSDYAALMFTTNWANLTPTIASANITRSIGTYSLAQATNGSGIRPYPYSYNMANVNPLVTYAGVGNSSRFSQPHGIGSIWATMLWDMTWEIILQDNQIVNNIYDTPTNITDMRGNIAALKLVNEGLRLQPCSPSFVDARDAILQADQLLFGGRYRCAIGRAFARRGLGANASTGTSTNDRIVVEDYTPIGGMALTSPTSVSICSNTAFTYTATTGSTSTITYSWTRAAVSGISNQASSGSTANINETLVNTTNAPITVQYLFQLSPNPCGNSTNTAIPVNVTVNPTPSAIVSSYTIDQNASVPNGEGLVASNSFSNEVNGIISNTGGTYVRSYTGTVYSAGATVYYKTYTFVAPITGVMTFETTAGSLYHYSDDTYLSIYQNAFNPASPSTNFLVADDDSGPGRLSYISQNVTAGTTYVIVVSTWYALDYGTFTLRASQPVLAGTANWYLNASGGTPLANGNVFNPVGVAGSGIPNTATPGTYHFYLASDTYPLCRQQVSFNIQSLVSVGGTLPNNINVCAGNNSGRLSLTGQVGSIVRWELSTDNFENVINPIPNTSTEQHFSNITQNTQFRAVVQNGSHPIAYSSIGQITVGTTTIAGAVSGNAIICSGDNIGTLTLSEHQGTILRWESSTNNFTTVTNISNTSASQNYQNLSQSTSFRAVVQNGSCTTSYSTPAHLTTSPGVGGTVSSNMTVCSGANNGTLTLSSNIGDVRRWESSTDNFSTITSITNTGLTQGFSNLTQTTQYRAVVQLGTCAEVYSTSATITTDSPTVGGSVSSDRTVCQEANSGTLNLIGHTGNVLRWESSTDNFITRNLIANTTTSLSFLNITQETQYRAIVQNGTCSLLNSTPAKVSVLNSLQFSNLTVNQATCSAAGSIAVSVTGINQPSSIVINGSLTATDSVQVGRLFRDGYVSSCTSPKSNPGIFDQLGNRYFDSYYFTNHSQSPVCVSINLTGTSSTFMCSTYSGSFNPSSPSTNYLADAGDSGSSLSYSVTIPAGSRFIVVVHALEPSSAIGSYRLTINGLNRSVEYSKNNGVSWQSSSTFSGLSQGSYRVVVRYVGSQCTTSYPNNPIVINNVASRGGVTRGSTTACSTSNSGIITLSGYIGDILRWESSTDNFITQTSIANSDTTLSFSNLSQTTQFRAIVQDGVCGEAASSTSTITILSNTAPTALGAIITSGNATTLTATGCSGVLKWYKTNDNSLVNMPISPSISTQYYAICEQSSGNTVCLSAKSNDVMLLVIPTNIIYVNNASTAIIQDGTSWANAISNLQIALTNAVNGAEIWVAKGTYFPTTTLDRTISFNIPAGVKVYGGFNGTETSMAQRNGKTNVTTLDGNIGTTQSMTDNSYHVVTLLNNSSNATIDGFTITNGYAADQAPSFQKTVTEKSSGVGNTILSSAGGGIYCKNSSPVIKNCNIVSNSSTYGAGIFTEQTSNPTINFCIISGNAATLGAGVYNTSSNPNISNCLITGNKGFGGAAIYNSNSNPIINNVTISGNDCLANVVFNSSGTTESHPVITNSIIWNNTGSNIGTSSIISYSNVEGGYTGTGNINVDPQFVTNAVVTNAPSLAGNFRLLVNSLSINTGNNGTISLTDTDLDGKLRRYDGETVDMGAYEYIFYFDSATTGNWDNSATWTCNCIPDGSLPVRINSNHMVTVPDGYTGQAKGLNYRDSGTINLQGTGIVNVSN